jgi:hypothetical protein
VLYAFLLFVAAICILCNLMGPATAFVLLPTVGWGEIRVPEKQAFAGLAAGVPPRENIDASCNSSAIAAGQYSCTESSIAPSLDSTFWNYDGNAGFQDLNPAGLYHFHSTSLKILLLVRYRIGWRYLYLFAGGVVHVKAVVHIPERSALAMRGWFESNAPCKQLP